MPSRAAFDRLQAEFGEGEFAPIVLAIRTDGAATSPANLAALYDYSRRLAADPRIARVDSLVDVDPRLTLAQYPLLYGDPNGPRDRYVQTGAGGDDQGRPDGVHALHAVRPEPRRGQGAGRRPAATRQRRSRRRPG